MIRTWADSLECIMTENCQNKWNTGSTWSIFHLYFRLLHLILQMRIPQLPRLMSRAKLMLHPSLKMRSLHFHTQTWQSWMTWSTGIFTLFKKSVDDLSKHLDSGIRIFISLLHFSKCFFCWVKVVKRKKLEAECGFLWLG